MNNALNKKLLYQNFTYREELNVNSYCEIAASYAITENAIAVLSDLKLHRSYVFHGGFSEILELAKSGSFFLIDSIWENDILSRIPACDLAQKQLDELQFFDFVKRNGKRDGYYMVNVVSMYDAKGEKVKVLHRIFYFHEGGAVRYALCLYTPTCDELPSAVIDSLSGKVTLLTQIGVEQILSEREKEILLMIDDGMLSKEIAAKLNISIYTVNRHRQNILEKLRAKNSSHACKMAKGLRII